MYSRSRGREEPYGPLSDLGPLVLVPGVVEEGDLRRSSALRQPGEAFEEGRVCHAGQRATGIYAREGGGMAGEACSCDGVVERGDRRRERELPADMSRRFLAERKTVFSAGLVEDFGLHARDVHAGGTFRLARLAANAEVHDLLHALSRQLFGREGAFDHGPEHVGPRPRGVLLVEGHHIGGTHRAPRPLPAEAAPVAQLDGLREATLILEGEARLYGEASPAWADT